MHEGSKPVGCSQLALVLAPEPRGSPEGLRFEDREMLCKLFGDLASFNAVNRDLVGRHFRQPGGPSSRHGIGTGAADHSGPGHASHLT